MTQSQTDDLLQAAWLYHVGQLSQEEVSRRLGISRFKVLRLLAEAREMGLVRVTLEHETSGTLALADRLAQHFDLTEAQVAPMPGGIDGEEVARRAVGIVAAGFLTRIGRGDGPINIGVGWGRTMAAMAHALTGLRNPNLCFVSLMGSMARTAETSPFDVCTRLASITGGSAMFLPAPFLTDTEADCRVVLNQRLVRETLQAARGAQYSIISLGDCSPAALLTTSGILTQAETDRSCARGGRGRQHRQVLLRRRHAGRHRPEPPRPVHRAGRSAPHRCDAAGRGVSKTAATLALMRAGIVRRLITDEGLARALLAASDARGEAA
jgi:DNA-binding transcriptional regulator LsrR (DeoR family)